MAQVWSVSQNKFIDTGAGGNMPPQAGSQPSAQPDTQSSSLDDLLIRALQYQAVKTANTPSEMLSAATSLIEKNKKKELTADEKKAQLKQDDIAKTVKNLEDIYFSKKLHYGPGVQGLLAELTPAKFRKNTPYGLYVDNLEAIRPKLAKAAGDSGNLAYQEQLQAGRPFPTALSNYNDATERFKIVRENLGLPPRDYTEISQASDSIKKLKEKYGY